MADGIDAKESRACRQRHRDWGRGCRSGCGRRGQAGASGVLKAGDGIDKIINMPQTVVARSSA